MLNLTDPEFARWRVWAAALRDAGGPNAEDAGLLCRVLDLHEDLRKRAERPDSAANMADGLKICVDTLIRRLTEGGAEPPGGQP